MDARLSFVTLGVTSLTKSAQFYDQLVGAARLPSPPEVVFYELGKTWLALYPRELLAEDAGVDAARSGFSGIALAHNVRSPQEVDELLRNAEEAGGRIVKEGRKTDWGGYAGYFSDPDGYLWEVAWNSKFPHV